MFQNIGITQLLILLAIIVLIFGTKRLRNLGSDLGGAIKGFRKGLQEDDEESPPAQIDAKNQSTEEAKREKTSHHSDN